MGLGVQSPSQFKLVSRYCNFWYNLRPCYPQKQTFATSLLWSHQQSCGAHQNLAWAIPEVRSEIYNNKVNSSGKVLAGTDIAFPRAILPVLQPVPLLAGGHSSPLAHSRRLWITMQQSLQWSSSHRNKIQQCLHYRGLNNLSERTISLAQSDTFVQQLSCTPCLPFAYIVQALLRFWPLLYATAHGAQAFNPHTEINLRLIWSLDTLRNTGHPCYVHQHTVFERSIQGISFPKFLRQPLFAGYLASKRLLWMHR